MVAHLLMERDMVAAQASIVRRRAAAAPDSLGGSLQVAGTPEFLRTLRQMQLQAGERPHDCVQSRQPQPVLDAASRAQASQGMAPTLPARRGGVRVVAGRGGVS